MSHQKGSLCWNICSRKPLKDIVGISTHRIKKVTTTCLLRAEKYLTSVQGKTSQMQSVAFHDGGHGKVNRGNAVSLQDSLLKAL